MCDSECSECVDSADFCQKCSDASKFANSDGTCLDDASSVTCRTSQFKNPSGMCIDCHASCDQTVGCSGDGNDKCLKCGADFKALMSNTENTPTTYECGFTCPVLSEESTTNGQQACKVCTTDSEKPVYDFKTKMCISEADGCPDATVMTTLGNMIAIDTKFMTLFTEDDSDIKI